MKKLVIIFLSVLISAAFNLANSQSLDEILEKHFKAAGQEKLVKTKSIHIKARLSQMGMDMPMEMKVKKPDKFLVTVEMQGQKMIQAFDGEKGWMIMPWLSPEPQGLSGDQLAQARQQADFEGELYNFAGKGSTAELLGKVNVDGKDVFRIKLTPKNGSARDYFIDADTYLISKVKTSVSAQGQTIDVEQIMSDYKTIDGITMATKIESKMPVGNTSIIFDEITFDEDFDDSIFKQPAK